MLFFDLYEIYLSSSIASAAAPSLGGNTLSVSLMLSALYIGGLFGSIVLTRVADRKGRRAALLWGAVIYGVGAVVAALSPSMVVLIAARFVTGFGVGAVQPLVDTYCMETQKAHLRGRYLGVIYTIAGMAAPASFLLTYFGLRSTVFGAPAWRTLVFLGVVGPIVLLLARRHLPEAPRWAAEAGAAGAAAGSSAPRGSSLRELLSARWRRVTVSIATLNFFSSIVYYGFGTLAPLLLHARGYSVLSSFGYSAISFLGYPLGGLLGTLVVDRIDRKWVVVVGHALLAGAGALFAIGPNATVVVAGGFVYGLIANIVALGNHVYGAESFPALLRASGNGITYAFNKAGVTLMPLTLVPLLSVAGPGPVFTVVGACIVVIVVVVGLLGPRSAQSPVAQESVGSPVLVGGK
ncbi:MFS transporter [Sinomonas atrocyanea]